MEFWCGYAPMRLRYLSSGLRLAIYVCYTLDCGLCVEPCAARMLACLITVVIDFGAKTRYVPT